MRLIQEQSALILAFSRRLLKADTDGVYTTSMADAEVVRAAINRANQIVLVAEKYKFTNQITSPYMSIPFGIKLMS